jgi:stage II sporulation protein R
MKKICIIFLLSIIICLTAFGFGGIAKNEAPMSLLNMQANTMQGEYLRIHIRANDNSNEAQAVKYRVRDRLVEYLTPIVAECPTKKKAMQKVAEQLHALSHLATETLHEAGFLYGAEADLTVETFPTRVYGEYTLPAGEYSALIVRLGKGEGDNWWCVVYPPLCFAATTADVVYKSKIKEIIDRFYIGG